MFVMTKLYIFSWFSTLPSQQVFQCAYKYAFIKCFTVWSKTLFEIIYIQLIVNMLKKRKRKLYIKRPMAPLVVNFHSWRGINSVSLFFDIRY